VAVEIAVRGDYNAGPLQDAAKDVEAVGAAGESSGGKLKGFFGVLGGAAAGAGLAAIGAVGAGLFEVSGRADTARTALQGLNDVNMQGVLNDATLLESRYGADLQGVLGASRTLMSEFGLSSDEAMDLIVSGFENGLDTSGDFLDSIGEYSNLFAEAGAGPEEFFSTLQTGLAGGALGTDKAADAFKEFGIRIMDGSDTTRAALADLGIEDVLTQLRDGTISAADAFPLVQDALRGVEDPLLQAQLGVALFGTQWEDLGASAVLGINMAQTSMADLEATADSGRARFTSLGEIFPRLWGEFTTALLPANDALLGFINSVFTADDPVAELGNQIQTLGTRFIEWVQGALPGWIEGLAQMGQRLGQWVVDALPGLITNLSDTRTRLVSWVLDSLPGWASQLAQLGQKLLQWVIDALPGLGTNLGKVLALLISKSGEFIAETAPRLLDLGVRFVQWVAEKVLPELPGMLVQVGSAILTAIGNFISEVAPELGKLAQQFLDWVTTEVLPELPGKLAEVGTTITGGIQEFVSNSATELANAGRALIANLWDGISGRIGQLIQDAKDALKPLADLLPGSEPKDKSSPLYGLAARGRAFVGNLASGMEQAAPQLRAVAAEVVGGAAAAVSQSSAVNVGGITINQQPGERGDLLAGRAIGRLEQSLALRRG
jgi:hypothetical protein